MLVFQNEMRKRERRDSTFDLNVVFPTPEEPMMTNLMVGMDKVLTAEESRARPRLRELYYLLHAEVSDVIMIHDSSSIVDTTTTTKSELVSSSSSHHVLRQQNSLCIRQGPSRFSPQQTLLLRTRF
jgi:hypothetical protein